jgi:hypothetical protein
MSSERPIEPGRGRLIGPVVGVPMIMRAPLFSLEKRAAAKSDTAVEANGERWRLTPSSAGRIATLYDRDMVLYALSCAYQRFTRTGRWLDRVDFTAHDCMRVTRRDTSQKSYRRLLAALARLAEMRVERIDAGAAPDERERFAWISDVEVHTRNSASGAGSEMQSISLRLTAPLLNALIEQPEPPIYHNRYFDLSPLERRLYDLALLGSDAAPTRWTLQELHSACGARVSLRGFGWRIRQIVELQPLPDIHVALSQAYSGQGRCDLRGTAVTLQRKSRARWQIPRPLVVLSEYRPHHAEAGGMRKGAVR